MFDVLPTAFGWILAAFMVFICLGFLWIIVRAAIAVSLAGYLGIDLIDYVKALKSHDEASLVLRKLQERLRLLAWRGLQLTPEMQDREEADALQELFENVRNDVVLGSTRLSVRLAAIPEQPSAKIASLAEKEKQFRRDWNLFCVHLPLIFRFLLWNSSSVSFKTEKFQK